MAVAIAESFRLLVLACRGDESVTSERFDVLLTQTQGFDIPQMSAQAFPTAAFYKSSIGAYGDAIECVRSLAAIERIRDEWYFIQRIPLLARVCVSAGDIDLARSLAVGVKPNLVGYENVLVAGAAVVAEAEGRLHDAIAAYGDAAERWGAFACVPERAYALLGNGRCLLRLGRSEVAASLKDARDIFVGLAARPLVEELDILLAEATARTS